MGRDLTGYLYVLLAASMWGVGGTVAKLAFNQAVNPLFLVKMRLTFSFLLLLPFVCVFRREHLSISRQDVIFFAVLGVAGLAMVQFTYLFTISQTNVATAVFLQYTSPALVAAWAVLFGGERLGWMKLGAVAMAVLGGLFILLGNFGPALSVNSLGLLSGVASAGFAAFYTVYGKRGLNRVDPWVALTYALGFGAAFAWLAPSGWTAPGGVVTGQQWGLIWYIVVFSTAIPFGLYFMGLKRLPSTHASVTATLEPVIAAVVAFLALGEVMRPIQIAGSGLIILAVLLLQIREPEPVLEEKRNSLDMGGKTGSRAKPYNG